MRERVSRSLDKWHQKQRKENKWGEGTHQHAQRETQRAQNAATTSSKQIQSPKNTHVHNNDNNNNDNNDNNDNNNNNNDNNNNNNNNKRAELLLRLCCTLPPRRAAIDFPMSTGICTQATNTHKHTKKKKTIVSSNLELQHACARQQSRQQQPLCSSCIVHFPALLPATQPTTATLFSLTFGCWFVLVKFLLWKRETHA